MFRPTISREELSAHVGSLDSDDFARFLYCQHIAATYLAVAQFEDLLIAAMLLCDRVKVRNALGADAERWEKLLARQEALRSSTLGSLIKILEGHDIASEDIRYLKWLRDKRDYFVHRLFHDGAWPGHLNASDSKFMTRRLIAIQHWLRRGQRRVWFIFERANLVVIKDLGEAGLLAINPDLLESNDE